MLINNENSEIKIVRAVPKDVRMIQEVRYKAWLVTYPNEELGITVDDVEDRFKNVFSVEGIKEREDRLKNQSSDQQTFVAKQGGKIVGFCAVARHADKNQLQAIYILPEFHGKGIGKKLWNRALEFFDLKKDITVEVATYNAQAIAFYERLGFKDTGRRFSDEGTRMKSGAIIPEMEMVIKAKRD